MSKTILVTGGAGYIGSHTIFFLQKKGYEVVVVDDLVNASAISLSRVSELTGKDIKFYQLDVCDTTALEQVFAENQIDGVIHFAGLKAVGESVAEPMKYYKNNLISTLSLLEVMQKHAVQKIVFSSSATTYNDPGVSEYDETTTMVTRASNPYGTTKVMQEWILEDLSNATLPRHYEEKENLPRHCKEHEHLLRHCEGSQNPRQPSTETSTGLPRSKGRTTTSSVLQAIALRYFNPVGAHPSGRIGEDPLGVPQNLTPYITQVAVGVRDKLNIWGDDYDTPDGTCIRDYIHIMDLARAHYSALEHLFTKEEKYFDAINIGSGTGYSVLEVLHAFEEAVGQPIPYVIGPRRAGDLPKTVAKTQKAKDVLGFEVEHNMSDMARDAWNWQKNNPRGYSEQ